jgi:hypothetical protein
MLTRDEFNRREDRRQERGVLADMTKHIRDQEEWIRDHGATLDGYIERYGSASNPKSGTDGGPAIYQADIKYLELLVSLRNNAVKAIRAHR